MKFRIFHFLVLIILFGVGDAFAGSQKGLITYLVIHYNDSTLLEKMDVTLDGVASVDACASEGWSVEFTADARKAQYAMLLASYMAGKKVQIDGNGPNSCYYGKEKIRNVRIVVE